MLKTFEILGRYSNFGCWRGNFNFSITICRFAMKCFIQNGALRQVQLFALFGVMLVVVGGSLITFRHQSKNEPVYTHCAQTTVRCAEGVAGGGGDGVGSCCEGSMNLFTLFKEHSVRCLAVVRRLIAA